MQAEGFLIILLLAKALIPILVIMSIQYPEMVKVMEDPLGRGYWNMLVKAAAL
jgi:hypothetical protein